MLGDRIKSRLQCYFHSGFRSMQASWVAIRSEFGLSLSLESWVNSCETCGGKCFVHSNMMWEDFFGLHKICILWIFGWISRFFHFFHFSILGLFGFVRGSCGSFFRRGTNWTWRTMTTRFRMMTMRLAPSHLEQGLMIDRKEGKEIGETWWKINEKTIQCKWNFRFTHISYLQDSAWKSFTGSNNGDKDAMGHVRWWC